MAKMGQDKKKKKKTTTTTTVVPYDKKTGKKINVQGKKKKGYVDPSDTKINKGLGSAIAKAKAKKKKKKKQ